MARRLGVYGLGKYFSVDTVITKKLYNPLLGGEETWQMSELHSGHPEGEEFLETVLTGMQMTFEQVQDKAQGSQDGFFPLDERRAYIENFRAEFVKSFDNLVQLLQIEVAKPYQLAKIECERALKTIDATLALFANGNLSTVLKPTAGETQKAESQPSPLGIALAVTPFNFPVNLVLHKILPALAAGCPVVWRPSPKAQLVSLALLDVLHAAHLPAGMLAFCPMNNDLFWKTLHDPRIACVSFTGSSAVGWKIHSEFRGPLTLELGGMAPVWIDPSVSESRLDSIASELLASAFSFGGQSCISAQNLFVPKNFSAKFFEKLDAGVKSFPAGPAWNHAVKCAGVIDADSQTRINRSIEEARTSGSKIVAAENKSAGKNIIANFVPPTLIYHPPENIIVNEMFAPTLNVTEIENFDEFLARTNAFSHRLQAAVYADDAQVLKRAASRLNFGGVALNTAPSVRIDALPYGGRALSGIDAEAPILAYKFFAPYKTVYK